MKHYLQSAEIRQMYDLLYKYERELKNIPQKDSIVIDNLDVFFTTNDIYVDTLNKTNIGNAKSHNGYALYNQARRPDKYFWLIRHLRNAFAHGYVHYDKGTGNISFIDGDRKIKSEMPRSLVIPFFQILMTAKK